MRRTARERLRIERQRDAARARNRQRISFIIALLAALSTAAIVVYLVAVRDDGASVATPNKDESRNWDTAASRELIKPANTSGKNGTLVTLGDGNAETVIDIYEDIRSPACMKFYQDSEKILNEGVADGRYKLRIHFGDILDSNDGSNKSKIAISALGAALNVSTNAFSEYRSLLYSAYHRPDARNDSFSNISYLLDAAQGVTELNGNKEFEAAVTKGIYNKWALEVASDFLEVGVVQVVPAIQINGRQVETDQALSKLREIRVGQ